MTLTPTQANELLSRHGLVPRRALGQNFVVDPNTVRRIAKLAGVGPGSNVIEVGPGLGSLTLALADTGAHVTAVELDHGLATVAREVTSGRDVQVIQADAMTLDWNSVLGDRPWTMVANLPYNIATPLVMDLLDDVPAIESFVVMVQREVGERFVAGPSTEAYGAVSVKVAYWTQASLAARVSAAVFLPRPNVESVVVRMVRRPSPAVDPALAGTMFALVRAGFAKRRKMLRGSLSGLVTTAQFDSAEIRADARAEELGVVEWGRLAGVVHADRLRAVVSPVNPVNPVNPP
jgi:16S rRNA (adenine1518-N6/adenine1519-N6)-dimethyltransferase